MTSAWEHSSAGRASALQAEGHRFEPYCSHQYSSLNMREWLSGRASPCQGECREFESRFPLHFFIIRYNLNTSFKAPSPSGKARVCKTLIPSSNLGGASTNSTPYSWSFIFNLYCRCGGIGRRKGLKIPRSNIRAGSSPASGTTKIVRFYLAIFFLPLVFYKGFLSYKIFWEIANFG